MTADRDPFVQANVEINAETLRQPRQTARHRPVQLALAGSVILHASLLIAVSWALQRQASLPDFREHHDRLPIQVSLIAAPEPFAAPPSPPETEKEAADALEPDVVLEAVTESEASSVPEMHQGPELPSTARAESAEEHLAQDNELHEAGDPGEAGVGRRIVSGLPALIRGTNNDSMGSLPHRSVAVVAPRLPGSDRVIVAGMPLRVQRSPAEQTLAVINFFTGGSAHLDPCLMEERLLTYDDLDSVRNLVELRRRCRGRERGSP